MPRDKVTVEVETETPAFVVRFWDVSKEKLRSRGHKVTSDALSKKWRKGYFAGLVKHVQSGDTKIFHSVSEFHAFIEKHRL